MLLRIHSKSLIAFLLLFVFGCTDSDQVNPAQIPQFPKTTDPTCRVIPIQLDTGFYLRSFIIAPNKHHVYGLADRRLYNSSIQALQLIRWDTQLVQIDSAGRVEKKMELLNNNPTSATLWWTSDAKLAVMVHDTIRMYNPDSLQIVEDWPVLSSENSYSKEQRQTLSGEELDELYTWLIQKAFRRSQMAYVSEVPSGEYFLFLRFEDQTRQAWHIDLRLQDVNAYIKKFGERMPLESSASLNPDSPIIANYHEISEGAYLNDSDTHLRFIRQIVLSQPIGYTNAEIRVFQLSNSKKTVRFRVSDLEPHQLAFQIAANGYLTTEDGTVWIYYERNLYRVEMGKE